MPIYDYKCTRCANEWEEFRKLIEKERAWCEECGGSGLSMISVFTRPHVYDYYCDQLEARVTGRQQRKELMKEREMRDEWT